MAYRILEHTADVRMVVEARTLEELFREALGGMMEVLKPDRKKDAAETTRRIELDAASATPLLVDFLNEALCLAHTNREAFTAVVIEGISETRVEAELRGAAVESFGEDIKAATYHEAKVRRNAAGNLETVLVFDI
ncbi:MAG TPA: archease [Patescibacteria group bacterium]|nr:archease [Patescibacteria group bacterium]